MEPIYIIGFVAFFVSFMITLANKLIIDQNVIKELKKDIKRYQTEIRNNRDNLDKVKEIQPKMMELSMKQIKMTFKPMKYYFIPIIIIFSWLRKAMEGKIILSLPFWPYTLGWLGTYIIFSITFSTFLRKLLKLS